MLFWTFLRRDCTHFVLVFSIVILITVASSSSSVTGPDCYGKNGSSACSYPNGTCSATDHCECQYGHVGNECQFLVCFNLTTTLPTSSSLSSSVTSTLFPSVPHRRPHRHPTQPLPCSSPAGSCISPDTCTCTSSPNSNFGGPQCAAFSSTSQQLRSRDHYTEKNLILDHRLVLWSSFEIPGPDLYVFVHAIEFACFEAGWDVPTVDEGTGTTTTLAKFFVYYEELLPVVGDVDDDELRLVFEMEIVLECDGSVKSYETTTTTTVLPQSLLLLPSGKYRFGSVTNTPVVFPVSPIRIPTYQKTLADMTLPKKINNILGGGLGHLQRRNNMLAKPIYALFRGSVVLACGGIRAGEAGVCSDRGKCVLADVCLCEDTFSGPACEFHSCGGIAVSSSTVASASFVCSGHGICLSSDLCQCAFGYFGPNCEKHLNLYAIVGTSVVTTLIGTGCVVGLVLVCCSCGVCVCCGFGQQQQQRQKQKQKQRNRRALMEERGRYVRGGTATRNPWTGPVSKRTLLERPGESLSMESDHVDVKKSRK